MLKNNKSKSSKVLNIQQKFINHKDTQITKPTFLKKCKKQKKNADKIIGKTLLYNHHQKTGTNSEMSSLDKKLSCLNLRQHFRKTASHIQGATSSVQNDKKTSIDSKSKEKCIKIPQKSSLKDKKSFEQEKDKFVLKYCLVQNTLGQYTSVDCKLSQKNQRPLRNCRKSAQTYLTKVTSKCKAQNQKKHLKNGSKMLKNSSKTKLVKSSCITRNVSRKNSKSKQHRNIDAQIKEKFKKKTQLYAGLQKKAKKLNAYSSMKISPRNSFKIIQTKSNKFHNEEPKSFTSFCKLKANTKEIKLNKIKSLRDISQRLQELLNCQSESENLQNIDKQITKKTRQFSFFKYCLPINPTESNKSEVSIDRFLQNTEDEIEFSLVCEESLKQKLSRIQEQSLKRLKQEQFSSIQKLQALNSFERHLNNERSYSTSSELFHLAQINLFSFQSLSKSQNQHYLKQRIELVDWLSMLSSTMLLKTQTFHLTVAYFDIYLSFTGNHFLEVNFFDLKLIGLGCLLIAIKMDEREYEHDIFNIFGTLEKQFRRDDIVKTELQILKKLKLKLKIQTLVFWLDYFSQKWDYFLINHTADTFQQKNKMFLRSIDGKSYENYRKAIEIMNAILLQGGIFSHGFIDLILSIFYLVFQEIIRIEHREKVFQQINTFRNNFQGRLSEQKMSNFTTQDTLDQLSLNQSKENLPQNQQNLKSSDDLNCKQNKVKLRKSYDRKQNLEQSLQKNKEFFNQFVQKYAKKPLNDLQDTIRYVEDFSEIKLNLEMDQRVYEQAQSYEEFIRYHSYSSSTKLFVIKKCEDLQKNKNETLGNFISTKKIIDLQTLAYQKHQFPINVETVTKRQPQFSQKDNSLNYYINDKIDPIFTTQQIDRSSTR